MKFLSDLSKKDLSNRICLLRIDLNIQDADLRGLTRKIPFRIEAVLPTIKFLTDRKAKVVIFSHRGRPIKEESEKRKEERFGLKPFVKILSFLLGRRVSFISQKEFGLIDKTKKKIQNSAKGSIFLLENLRFFSEEEKNDAKFAKQLASLGDFYVNDAFAVSHRKNASVVAITKELPSYAGLLLEKEIKNLDKIRGLTRTGRGLTQKNGLVIILGGAKISDKIGVIKNLLKRVDYFLLGGGVANTFFAAQDLPMGDSLYDKNANLKYHDVRRRDIDLILPIDLVVYKRQILDIGPRTIEKYSKIIKNAKTIIWNGPMGYFENPKFAKGSKEIAKAIMANKKAFSVVGGGETTPAFQAANPKFKILNPKSDIFISTGGGAMLEYLAGKKLPGIEALKYL